MEVNAKLKCVQSSSINQPAARLQQALALQYAADLLADHDLAATEQRQQPCMALSMLQRRASVLVVSV